MRRPQIPGGLGFPFGAALGVGVTIVSVALGAAARPVLSVVALIAVVGAIAMVTTVGATLAVTVVCWCLHAGFVLGGHGDLAFTTTAGRDALILAANALAAFLIASTVRAAAVPLHGREYDPTAPRVPTQGRRVPAESESRS